MSPALHVSAPYTAGSGRQYGVLSCYTRCAKCYYGGDLRLAFSSVQRCELLLRAKSYDTATTRAGMRWPPAEPAIDSQVGSTDCAG